MQPVFVLTFDESGLFCGEMLLAEACKRRGPCFLPSPFFHPQRGEGTGRRMGLPLNSLSYQGPQDTMIGCHSFYLFPESEGRDGIFIPHLSALGSHPGVLRGSTSFILIKAERGRGEDAIFKV